MSSDKIDQWVTKKPESWAKLAENTKKKETFANFKKKFLKGAREQGKEQQVKQMTNSQLRKIYEASGLAKTITKDTQIKSEQKAFKPKRITVKRKGKTYKRTILPRYKQTDTLALNYVAGLKPRSPEYNKYVNNLVESTGRSRQAIVKKIYRVRKAKK
jgi:hypothetical protein